MDKDHQIDKAIEQALEQGSEATGPTSDQQMEADRSFAHLVGELQDLAAEFAIAQIGEIRRPSPAVRDAVMSRVTERTPSCLSHFAAADLEKPVVVTDVEGCVQWISPAFTEMCGYTIDELRGKKPGSLLQGPDTDRTAIQTMSSAVHAHQNVKVELINYHKNGDPYRVRIEIEPIYAESRTPMGFVAREEKLESLAA